MVVAQNIFIDREDVVETARGLGSSATSGFGLNTYSLTLVNNCIIAAASNSAGVGPLDPGAGAGQPLFILDNTQSEAQLSGDYYLLGTGLISAQAANCVNAKLDCFTAKQNTYISTQGGVIRINGTDTSGINNHFTNYGAGMPKPLAPEFTYAISAGGILAKNTAYRYRTVYVRVDTYNNRIFSPPSEPVIVYGDNANVYSVTLRQALPGKQVRPGDIIQVYRSIGVSFPVAGSLGVDPGDELQLSTEYVIASGDITAATPSFVSIPDATFDTSLGAYLYTNQNTGDGINAAEYAPPLCQSMCLFKNVGMYANTRQPPSIAWRLVTANGRGAPPYVFTITNGTTTYTATSAAFAPPANYTQVTPGNGTFSDDAVFTARQIMAMVTVFSNNNPDVQLYYVGRAVSNVAVGAVQNLPFLSTLTGPSATNAQYSINFVTLGVGDRENGTWTLAAGGNVPVTNCAPNLPLTPVAEIGGNRVYFSKPNQPEAVPLLNYVEVGNRTQNVLALMPLRNSVFAFRVDGLYRLTGTTQQDITVELFDETIKLTHQNSVRRAGNTIFAATTRGIVEITEAGAQIVSHVIEDVIMRPCVDLNTFPLATAAACDAEKKYLFMPLVSGTSTAYVWNFHERLWSTMLFSGAQATVNGLASGTFATISGTILPKFSDRVWVAFANGGGSFVKDLTPISAASITYDKAPSVTYVVIDGNNPGVKKRFTDVSIILQGSTVTSLNVTFSTETSTTPETVPITGLSSPYVSRLIVPRAMQYCSQLTMTIAAPNVGEYLRLSGVSLAVTVTTLKTTR